MLTLLTTSRRYSWLRTTLLERPTSKHPKFATGITPVSNHNGFMLMSWRPDILHLANGLYPCIKYGKAIYPLPLSPNICRQTISLTHKNGTRPPDLSDYSVPLRCHISMHSCSINLGFDGQVSNVLSIIFLDEDGFRSRLLPRQE
jgi:hypothetical protein